jgi:hypothetical protein
MPGRVGLSRPRRPKRSDIAAGAVVLAFALAVCVVATGLFIQISLKPTDGRFGVPQYLAFPFCGHGYTLVDSTEMKSDVQPGFVVEPTVGKIPLLSLLTCPKEADGSYAGHVWLHVGQDKYVEYLLNGYP